MKMEPATRFARLTSLVGCILLVAGLVDAGQPSTYPVPTDGDWNVELTPTLRWAPAENVAPGGYRLYLGTDYDAVAGRDAVVHVGALDTTHHTPSDNLLLYRHYFWAVDVVNTGGGVTRGDVWSFKTRRTLNPTEGFYKDYFINGGQRIAGHRSLPSLELLELSGEFVRGGTMDGYNRAHYLMTQIDKGDWVDDNGVLLYPDGAPRYRLLFVGGGNSPAHGDSLLAPEGSDRVDAQERIKVFYDNGGSYVGSCAGAAMAFWWLGVHTHRHSVYFHFFDGVRGLFTNIGGCATDFAIPDGVTSYRGHVLPRSPLLKYDDFGGDYMIHDVRQNGGTWVRWWGETDGGRRNTFWHPKGEVLTVYTDTLNGEVVREGYKTTDGGSSWAYKRSERSGRMAVTGGHPERVQTGDRLKLQAGLFAYALDGVGKPRVKASLGNGVTRQMNDNATAGHEKIGDRQYHHFTIDVPHGAPKLQIDLSARMHDFHLFAKHGDFAFDGEPDVVAAANDPGSNQTIIITNPTPGVWYLGVKCVTVPERQRRSNYYEYTGNFEVLNGIAYSITATHD